MPDTPVSEEEITRPNMVLAAWARDAIAQMGRATYERDCRERSGDGFHRPGWDQLNAIERLIWERDACSAIEAFCCHLRALLGITE